MKLIPIAALVCLLGVTSAGIEEIQRLDCTPIAPFPLEIEPGTTETLTVEVDAGSLPPLANYTSFTVELNMWWNRGDVIKSADFYSVNFQLEAP